MVGQARSAGIKVVLATIPPWGVGALTTEADPSPARFERIDALNQWILAYGMEQGIPVVDYHAALQAADGENYVPSLTVDGCHPSPAGYDLMTPLTERAIQDATR